MFLREIAAAVLVGGESRRMGRPKALLPYRGRTLVEEIADRVQAVAGVVRLIGPVALYRHLGLPVVEDPERGAGPLSGIVTAISCSEAKWTLVVACDMPSLTREVLRAIVDHALASDADAVLAHSEGGWDEPLLAVYRFSCLPVLEHALAEGRYKVRDALEGLRLERFAVAGEVVRNANTPEEWARIEGRDEE